MLQSQARRVVAFNWMVSCGKSKENILLTHDQIFISLFPILHAKL
jgi:hypothetical protein